MQLSTYRIWLLIKKQAVENGQLYILAVLATMAIAGAVVMIITLQAKGLSYDSQGNIFTTGFTIPGILFSSLILSQIDDRTKAIQALTLPASAAEKLVMAIFYGLFLLPLIYIITIYPIILLGHYFDTVALGHINRLYEMSFSQPGIYMYFLLQGLAMLCSVCFRRYLLVKTLVSLALFFYTVDVVNPVIQSKILKPENIKFNKVEVHLLAYNSKGIIVQDTMVKQSINSPILRYIGPFSDVYLSQGEPPVIAFSAKMEKGLPYSTGYVLAISKPAKLVFHVLFILFLPFLWLITWVKLTEAQL